ncbi:hypothetical protein [Arthrobacter sp. L77]|uniref:hypothetical protein n=1 Tax=Arthrobacter sp. L77 TaxID=1496689 RepID=UPI0005BD27EF|nr:hypothetical protein [Arthrobacter sp. L77]
MDSKTFGRQLMYQWEMKTDVQLAFAKHAKDLEDRFATPGSAIPNGSRVDFRNYIDYLRVTRGLDAAFERLEDLRESGLRPDLYATAGMIAGRRAGKYGAAADFLVEANHRWPDDIGILVFLVETLLSAGRVGEATVLLAELDHPRLETVPSSSGMKLAELAALSGSWADAERLLDFTVAERGTVAVQALTQRIQYAARYAGQTGDLPVYVLNMPEDHRKLGLITQLYGKLGVHPAKHEGIDGRSLDPSSSRDLASHQGLRIGGGALGCALGHLSMWREFLAGQDSHALFIEDDGLPYAWRDLASVADDAGDFDVLFVNERMSALKAGRVGTGITHVWDALGSRPDSTGGWGTDGYMLSRKGAESLLDAVGTDKVLGHIDGQIAAYGILPMHPPLNAAQALGLSLRERSSYTRTLSVKCLDFPLVMSMDFGDSTIGRVGGHRV